MGSRIKRPHRPVEISAKNDKPLGENCRNDNEYCNGESKFHIKPQDDRR